MHYTKLFNEILDSTIWSRPDYVRVVWITMLAMRSQRHQVRASIPGLAARARVSMEQCEEAINLFMAPDKYSRTKDHEGRRIQECDGGWLILNAEKYQALMSLEERKSYQSLWQKNKRLESKIAALSRSDDSSSSLMTTVDVDDTVEYSKVKNSRVKKSIVSTTNNDRANSTYWATGFARFWEKYPKKRGKGAAEKLWSKLRPSQTFTEQIIRSVETHTKSPDWLREGGQFIPNPSTWLNQKRWEDTPDQSIDQAFRSGVFKHQKSKSEVELAMEMVDQENNGNAKENNSPLG